MLSKKAMLIAVVLVFFTLIIVSILKPRDFSDIRKVTAISFDECVAQGNLVMESYPRQCRTPEGELFVEAVAGQEIRVTGEFGCLPHANTQGPITLECALGIKDENGQFYGLSDPSMQFVDTFQAGKKAMVSGLLKNIPPESKYAIVGTIEVSGVESL